MNRFLPILVLPTALVAGAAVAAQAFQDTAALDQAVAGFTGHPIGEEGGAAMAIDKRLKLATCPTVALSWRSDRHDSVVVACPAPQWRIFVRVRMPTPPPVQAAAVAAPAAKPAIVIKRGDFVSIVASDVGFSVTRDGVAMNDAAEGGRVAVQVERGQPPIQAIAVEPGKARLPGAE